MSADTMTDFVQMTPKDYLKMIQEQYVAEWNIFQHTYNHLKDIDKWQIGISFYNSLSDQPKKKACYMSFLERQDDPNPKSEINVMRFLRQRVLLMEFQTS